MSQKQESFFQLTRKNRNFQKVRKQDTISTISVISQMSPRKDMKKYIFSIFSDFVYKSVTVSPFVTEVL